MDFDYLKNKVFETLDFSCDFNFKFESCKGFKISLSDNVATIGADSPSAVCRAFFEFAKAVSDGKIEFQIEKFQHFKWCGVMLDVSREGALKTEQIKKYIDMTACLGMNMIMLYTEDMYEMENYPFFGYKRGRYTVKELKDIDDYAYSLGIELIPCIQTLGHLENYLCWAEASPVKDTRWSILPGAEESLRFVEDMLKTCKRIFRSNNIHIGMDEAVWTGTGAYFKKHKGEAIDQHALLFDHLQKVCKLCKNYDYNPIIWSDLFFADSKTGASYTKNSDLPESFKAYVPDNVRFMYWEYHGKEKDLYKSVLESHKKSGNPFAFAGAGWCYESFTPNTVYSFKTNIPGLDASIETGCEMILNTLWGNGCYETSYFTCFPTNALYSEYMWSGSDATREAAWETNEFLTKVPKKVYDDMDCLHFGLDGDRRLARKLLRTDVFETGRAQDTGYLQANIPEVFENGEPMKTYFDAADRLEEYIDKNGDWMEYFSVAAAALRTAGYKAYIHTNLYSAYQTGNRAELLKITEDILPKCRESYKTLYTLFHKWWKRECRAFGWDWHCQRVGYQIAEIDYAKDTLKGYLNGELSSIDELEEKPLNQNIYYG